MLLNFKSYWEEISSTIKYVRYMKKKCKLFKCFGCSIMFFVVVACGSSNSKKNSISKQHYKDHIVDSIFVMFEETKNIKNLGQLSIFGLKDGQRSIDPNGQGFEAIYFDKNSNLEMLAIPQQTSYPVESGDSLIVSYKDYYPHIRILNNAKYSENELNFVSELGRRNISIFEYFFKKAMKITALSPESCYAQMNHVIDSCEREKVIGRSYAEWIRVESKYAYYSLGLSKEFPNKSIDFSRELNKPELLHSFSYRSFLTKFVYSHLDKNFSQEQVLAIADRYFEGEIRDFVIFSINNNLLSEEGDALKIKNMLHFLLGKFEDSAYLDILNLKYAEVFHSPAEGVNVLFDIQGNQITLDEVLNQRKGKVIYIDIWASWCVPCRAEFPYSKRLQEKLGDVVFLYLSIDKHQQQWLDASRKEKLNNDNTYLFSTPKEAEILKQYDIQSIPRYLIVGRDGKIINDKAPRPSDSAIVELLKSIRN